MSVVQVHKDPFSPVLLSSPPLNVTQEQADLIDAVIAVAASDSKFAQKAQTAIRYILTAGKVDQATVTSTTPQTVKVGDPSFTLKVMGTKFDLNTKIIVAGTERVTRFVSATEVDTDIDMSTVTAPGKYPVAVQSGNGVLSKSVDLTVNPPVGLLSSQGFAPIAQSTPDVKEKTLEVGHTTEKK